MKWFWQAQPKITPEQLEMAKHQIELQEQLDRQKAYMLKMQNDVVEFKADLIARSARIQELEIQMATVKSDVRLFGNAFSDFLIDLMPAQDAKIARLAATCNTLLSRIESVEESMDALEERNDHERGRKLAAGRGKA